MTYIVNHGGDQVVFVDPDLAETLAPIADTFDSVWAFVVMGDSVGGVDLPNAVAYEDLHRSTYLHTISNLANLPIDATDNVLPVVPMFHAAAWGFTFMATVRGAQLTFPGPDLSAPGLVKLLSEERVTISAGDPHGLDRSAGPSRRAPRRRRVQHQAATRRSRGR